MNNFLFCVITFFFFQNCVSVQDIQTKNTLVFEYDESYFTTYKDSPNYLYIADLPRGNGFCFEITASDKKIKSFKAVDLRMFVANFKKKIQKNIYVKMDAESFVKYLNGKTLYLKKGNKYYHISPILYIE